MSVAVRSTPRVPDSITLDLILGKPKVPYKISRTLYTLLCSAYRGNSSSPPRRWGLLATLGWGKKSRRIVSTPTTVASMHKVVNTTVSKSQFYKQVSKENAENESGVKNLKLLLGLCDVLIVWMKGNRPREESVSW